MKSVDCVTPGPHLEGLGVKVVWASIIETEHPLE